MTNEEWTEELWRRIEITAHYPMSIRIRLVQALCHFIAESKQRSRQ